jgi:hypothetical protein
VHIRRSALAIVAPRAEAEEQRTAQTREAGVSDTRVWTVEVLFTEDGDTVSAEARLSAGARQLVGWGRARRNPKDPDVPRIGEELATARALSDLSHLLVHEAAELVERFEGHPVSLRVD